MATFYVPEAGWTSGDYFTRLKVEQSYNSASNQSVFTVTPQYKAVYQYNTISITGGSITADGTTLKTFGIESGVYPYRAIPETYWTDIYSTVQNLPTSWTFTKTHNVDGSCSVVFAVVNVKLGTNTATFNGSTSQSFPGTARSFTLTISTDGVVSVSVTDNGTPLSNGASITGGHTLTVTAAPNAGYALDSFTINGTAAVSPASVTVAGNVSVVATGQAQGFANINDGNDFDTLLLPYICKADGTTWNRYRPFVYKNGSYQPY